MSTGSQAGAEFVATVEKSIDAWELIPRRAGVLVAVSGGADSVALLAALRELAGRGGRQWRLGVAHLHHGLRASADGDEAFVVDLSGRWGLPCVTDRCDVPGEAARRGRGVEETARMLRYEFLREAAERTGATCVAVGHHADDNVETVLHRMMRGTHLRGLSGMPSTRTLGGSPVRLVRPLLGCRRADVEVFCRVCRLEWRHDETNDNRHYRRNFIRHGLLPLLRREFPGVDEALLRLATTAGRAEARLAGEGGQALAEALREESPGRVAMDAAAMERCDAVIRVYALREACERAGVPQRSMTAERLDELGALAEGVLRTVALPGGFVARRWGGTIVVAVEDSKRTKLPGPVDLACPGSVQWGEATLRCEAEPFHPAAFAEHCRARGMPAHIELLDADCVAGPLAVRGAAAGDAFHPLGSPGTQKVSDFLINAKVPAADRPRIGCVCDVRGIVYLAPLRIADRVKVTPRTRRVLRIVWET